MPRKKPVSIQTTRELVQEMVESDNNNDSQWVNWLKQQYKDQIAADAAMIDMAQKSREKSSASPQYHHQNIDEINPD